ncbi:MAG: TetR/AcrR family transcriptional regulator [Sulfuricaulis sp.]
MNSLEINKRERLLAAANKLVHQQGFNQTTLADIAHNADVPLGNVYYYYKTKEEIGAALIEQRANFYRGLRDNWNQSPDPRVRLHAFIQLTIDNREQLARSGCPIGSLCQELHKEDGPLAKKAGGMFAELLKWLEAQFHALGKERESPDLALHLLSALQGASLLTNTFKDPELMLRETARLKQWVDAL